MSDRVRASDATVAVATDAEGERVIVGTTGGLVTIGAHRFAPDQLTVLLLGVSEAYEHAAPARVVREITDTWCCKECADAAAATGDMNPEKPGASMRITGSLTDADDADVVVGVDGDAVVIQARHARLGAAQAEEFARLFVQACWEAGSPGS